LLKRLILFVLLLSPLALSACGDGWEVVYTRDFSPYEDERTAGSGPVYVRKMMPVKSFNLKLEIIDAVVIEDDLHKSFNELQRKGKL